MNLPKNFVFATSMSKRLYDDPAHLSLKRVPYDFPNHKIYFFHENSFEVKSNQEINLSELPSNVILHDLFIDNPWLLNFLETSPFKDCYLLEEYYNKNAPFWFRKVVSISNFINLLEIGDVAVWVDCDCCITREFPKELLDYLGEHDWLSLHRKNDWTESGFYIININEKTKQFAKDYLNYYLSLEAFNEEFWADNWVIDACFKKFGQEMKLGGLTPDFGCPINILNYITHHKGPFQHVRSGYNTYKI